MQEQPFFSVIIPVYNREKYVARAIESVIHQTFKNWEMIIIDDGSRDRSVEIARSYERPNIRVICNEKNLERCVTRNKGVEAARGRYICYLDSDDYHLPHHFETLYKSIEKAGFPEAFFFTYAWDESDSGERTERWCPDFHDYDPFTYFMRYTVNPQRWAVHRHVMLKHPFDPEVTICEDMDTSMRMVAAGVPVFQVPERTTVYVAAPDSFTHGATDRREREMEAMNKIFRRPEFQGKLKKAEKNRLYSMLYYHMGMQAFVNGESAKTRKLLWKSYWLFPAGYNGKTNRSIWVAYFYSLPLFGPLVKKLVRSLKG